MTILGTLNRTMRLIRFGRPLYRVEGLRIRYMGEDDHDRVLFRRFVEKDLPHGFLYRLNETLEDRETNFREWLQTYAVGLNWHSFNAIYDTGEVRFEKPEDALAFRVTFNDLIDIKQGFS